MSVYFDKYGNFNKFYGIFISAEILNKENFVPLMTYLSKFQDFHCMRHVELRIFDIFSQTLAVGAGDTCKKLELFCSSTNVQYRAFELLPTEIVSFIRTELEEINFQKCRLKTNNVRLRIKCGKIFLKFDIEGLEQVIAKLNKKFYLNRKVNNKIILGFFKTDQVVISKSQLKQLKDLIPRKVSFCNINLVQCSTIDNYKLVCNLNNN